MPLSLVLLVASFTFWISKVDERGINNEKRLADIYSELNRREDINLETQKRLADKLEDIDRRLSNIQGALTERRK